MVPPTQTIEEAALDLYLDANFGTQESHEVYEILEERRKRHESGQAQYISGEEAIAQLRAIHAAVVAGVHDA